MSLTVDRTRTKLRVTLAFPGDGCAVRSWGVVPQQGASLRVDAGQKTKVMIDCLVPPVSQNP